ncbi:TPA: DUF3732 domain-containing protein [Stenotrophomonas maltophilia]|uniref:DUF3732 domain-containing protein n=1 Tax=Stenotrophomonas maltophilia TaxID=40324 RepID=UPI0014635BE1|nr:DUF3732 domain-containing protein [Stenotrophomonas maltophilia]MBH1379246.1 DUF3732 domain-containing protein [Stenotrophomonas maltophilia]MBH1395374.1 DUF3732 domain-containing protein [Stenotrophomonas maltophilia]MBH1468091.1 DUF3732 domain-containing protein [Stenotrophomonas maltophilia]MBH1471883.1 DUF3732 domain-containing protein [Stenotrophomonas maltophilia]QJP20322.1 DUF3732 domain-containing protein [Stenotrophomonas maltophilia]
MSLQIEKIVLYSKFGDVRELSFNIGGLSVLTGASKSGKSAIIDIIDYCTGRSSCNVADGVIRKHVGWYSLLLRRGEEKIFLARKNPNQGEKTSPEMYLERGVDITPPPSSALRKNITSDAVNKLLGSLVGINENEHRPIGGTRDPLEANIRHAILFCFQDQNDIDSKRRLFHRQDEDFIPQAIKDTLPYFLGAVDEDALLKKSELDQAKRQLRQLERRLSDGQSAAINEFPRGRILLDEAMQVGLVPDRSYVLDEELQDALKAATSDDRVNTTFVGTNGEEVLATLRLERQALRDRLTSISEEIRAAKSFAFDANGYLREAEEQRARLSSVGLIKKKGHDAHHCPICQSSLENPTPVTEQLERSLAALHSQLEAVQAENPRLQMKISRLMENKAEVENGLRENQDRLTAQIRENESLFAQQELFLQQARVIGKITQYLESQGTSISKTGTQTAIDELRARIEALENELDHENTQERLKTFLNIIGRYMTEYSGSLELEHANSQLRLDIKNLTVIADTMDGPVPLYNMGSGENWIGYHVIAHLALHKWFRQKGRPVPGFIVFDQPSQAHYPSDRDNEGSLEGLRDEDQKAVLNLFELISKVAKELEPDLQIIVLDHADLKRPWFEDAVVERWRNGRKLIPDNWIK